MNRFYAIIISVICLLGLSFYGLKNISDMNRYTGVREYSKPKPDTTPPTIEFLNYTDGDVITDKEIIDVQVLVTDDKTPSKNILIE